ncbi:MAG: LEA type 2 family protein, partial [Desulforhopalus sp.]
MKTTPKHLSPFFFLLILLLGGCAALRSDYEPPGITLNSFQLLPADSIAPRFAIGLRIINPNAQPLPLLGIAYDVAIEDEKVLRGVANDLPTVEAYGEQDIVLEASVDLLGGVKLITSLINSPREEIRYTF